MTNVNLSFKATCYNNKKALLLVNFDSVACYNAHVFVWLDLASAALFITVPSAVTNLRRCQIEQRFLCSKSCRQLFFVLLVISFYQVDFNVTEKTLFSESLGNTYKSFY